MNNQQQWITDRRPYAEDANPYGQIIIPTNEKGEVLSNKEFRELHPELYKKKQRFLLTLEIETTSPEQMFDGSFRNCILEMNETLTKEGILHPDEKIIHATLSQIVEYIVP